ARLMVLPQRPYVPQGSLREAIIYPHPSTPTEDARIADLLRRIGLSALVDRLDEEANWQQRLSLGEQQRLTLVRAILFAPDWLFLDEATASLDEPGERMVYALLREELPQASIVSIGHRSTLRALHDRRIDLGQDLRWQATSLLEPTSRHRKSETAAALPQALQARVLSIQQA
ncbi:MAG TPA: ATP-binding cassette domain-containing protein, partial [Hyphomicrobiaceae bacterium]|nr:ATP-binding cassette domain-containing protein [Hyphomicrobiaceae bacterium]